MNSTRTLRISCLTFCIAVMTGGCSSGSGSSGQGDREPPPDTTAPTVSSVQAPAADTLNRTVTLSVTASDAGGISEVRFFVDGVLLSTDTSSPFTTEWNTASVSDGDHTLTAEAQDAAGNVGRSSETTVAVRNSLEFTITAAGQQEVVPVDSAGTAQVSLAVNLASGEISGNITVNGITATAAHIHDGFAGTNGPVIEPFDQDGGDASLFSLPAGAMLDAVEVDRLLAGALYVNIHSAAWPGGELRGQVLPEGFRLYFTDLAGDNVVPPVNTPASGRAAITVDESSGATVVQARVYGRDDATQAHVHTAYAGDSGPVLVALSKDAGDATRWFAENAELNAGALAMLAAGRLYVNVHSPDNSGGEIRGQVIPDGITLFETELTGDQEVPAVDTRATGHAFLTLDTNQSLLTVHVNTTRLDDASGSHLHRAYGGISGPVEIGLTQDGQDPAHWFAEMRPLTEAQLDALLAGATYVNVHSPAHSGGEIRGQVIPDGIVFATGPLDAQQVVPPVSSDAGGTFAVTVDPATLTLVAHANTSAADDATAAHIHDAFAGTSGGVVVPLAQDATEGARWSATSAVISAEQLAALQSGRYYVNVHTIANSGGEIRGQVAPSPIEVLFTEVGGGQEVPAVASTAAGLAASTVNRDSGDITLHLRNEGADGATGAHVHMGYAGQNGPVLVPLEQDAGDPGHWSATGTQLDADGLLAYLEGRAYVNVHTAANPGGEIRGQIAPKDIRVLLSAMDGSQVVPPVTTSATGIASTTVDITTRSLAAFINASGADDATSAGIHLGGADVNGAQVLPLQQSPTNPAQWSALAGRLDAETFAAYRAGRLYAQVATPAETAGEIRGQIVPPDAALFDDLAPTVTLDNPGTPVSGTVTLTADASDDQGVTIVRFLAGAVLLGSDTDAPYAFEWDTTTFSDGAVTLTAEADDEAGNTGVSAGVEVTVQNGSPVTLSQIQAEVFGPLCSGCHSGPTGNSLPSGMNLSSKAASFAALVNVRSLQVNSLDRVEPGQPDNSYLVRKLEGSAGIVGSRMPQGGPFLDGATMDMIRQWISDGAANN